MRMMILPEMGQSRCAGSQKAHFTVLSRHGVFLICCRAGPLLRVTIVFYQPTEHKLKKIKFAVLFRCKSEGYKQIILTVELD